MNLCIKWLGLYSRILDILTGIIICGEIRGGGLFLAVKVHSGRHICILRLQNYDLAPSLKVHPRSSKDSEDREFVRDTTKVLRTGDSRGE